MDSKILEILKRPDIEFVLVALPSLKELIAKNEHPYVVTIPDKHKAAFLQSGDGIGVAVDRELVVKHYDGTIDLRQKFILDHCDIRVTGNWNKISKT